MTTTILQRPIINDMNNAISNSRMGMPIKDITSDGASTFEMNRKLFSRTYTTPATTIPNPGVAKVERNALGLSNNQAVITGPAVPIQKKWIGGNRDASQITKNRRVQQSGKTMANLQNQPISFVNDRDPNVIRQAITRVRGGGAANVPKARAGVNTNLPVFPNTR